MHPSSLLLSSPRTDSRARAEEIAGSDVASARESEVDLALESLNESVIMMVDDEPVMIEMLQAFLEDAGFRNFVGCTEPKTAVDKLIDTRPDVLFLDVVMPGMNGIEILRSLRDEKLLHDTPVIVLTSSSDPKVKLQALEFGAADFLSKPVDPSELVLRLRNTLSAKAYRDRLAYFDRVTGLPNRRMFIDRLDWACRHSKRFGDRGAVLLLDLDRFRQINEAFGPNAGDVLLREVGERLATCVRETDAIARQGRMGSIPSLSRLGGDEFSLLLTKIDCDENAVAVSTRLLDCLSGKPFYVEDNEVFLAASIGVSVFPDDGGDVDSLLKNAGVALRYAKEERRGQFTFFSKELNARALQRLNIESELRRAIENNEFRLHFQPKIHTLSGAMAGAEALARWQHPVRGLLGPMEFIPVAENSGLIVSFGERILLSACSQFVEWTSRGLDPGRISVNVSALQIRDPGFVDSVARILTRTGMPSERLCLELTESVILQRTSETFKVLRQLHELGLKLSIDDFGAGFTSLGHLKSLPFDELKIDKSFNDGIEKEAESRAIVAAVIALAHHLGHRVVAEGVETAGQHAFLLESGCDECQGYYFGRPVAAAEFEARWLPANRPAKQTAA
ncbi:MAG: putative bifunctional diguanylate cyclase/phosphodiesterase [Burkholderiales bacterium]